MKFSHTIISAAALAGAALAHPMAAQAMREPILDTRQTQSTEKAGTECADMTIVFARGTTERGNVGTLTGPPFFSAVRQAAAGVMSVAVQGVEYPADVRGFFLGGDPEGSTEMARLVTDFATRCPNTRIVMSGYSQGGQLVHNAADMISPDVTARVSSAVIFGDPMNGKPVGKMPASRTMVICHDGDDICAGGTRIAQAHLTYGQDAAAAAGFVMKQAQRA